MEHPCWKITRLSNFEFFPFILTLCLAHSRLSPCRERLPWTLGM